MTEAVIGSAFEVHNVLGYGFLEKVYQRAMAVELRARGFTAETEADIRVVYKGSRSASTGRTCSSTAAFWSS